jgi:hypothetical protein
MTYQVPLSKQFLYEKLPRDVQKRTVLKESYWITDEALQVYANAHSLISMEMHSPIMFTVLGKPAILLRQAEDTWKGQMWRDTGLQDWIFELNSSDTAVITKCFDTILQQYPQACAAASSAKKFAEAAGVKALKQIIEP